MVGTDTYHVERSKRKASREAFVTLATNDTYSLGCLVLGSSLRKVGTVRKLVVMVSKDVSLAMRSQLLGVFDFVMDVNVLDSQDPKNLALLGRPDLNVTFTKFHCWRLTQFDKCVFLDADTLVLQNVDELFDREELSAAPDAGWPDCFNSGVFVFKPSQETYDALLKYATTQGSFDGGDQGLLNMYFGDWATKDISKHLPFIYNVVSQAFYSYLPAFTQFKDTVKIVHFIGAVKPWHHTYNTSSRTVTPLPGTGHSQEFLQVWWNLFMSMVQPKLDPSLNVAELTQTLLYDLSRDIDDSPDRVPKETPRFIERYPSKTSVQSVYPYKLPDDVELFYDTKEDNPSDNPGHDRSAKDILDLPVEQREYTELESHYSEEPLSHINPDQPPGSAYDAKHISEGWEKDNFPPQHNDENSAGNSEKEEIETVINETEDKTNVTDRDEMGLCGDLAALDIQNQSWSVGKVDLSDAERKLNWEKGQIDYLGQDSFDNIQKKIQSSLDTHKEAVPVTKTSPFTPVQAPTPVLVKAPAPTPAPSQAVVKAPPSAVVKVPEPTPAPALTPVQATSQVNAPAPTPKQAPAPTPKQAPAPTPVQATSQAKVPAVGRVRPQKTAVPTAAPTAAPKAAPAAAPTAAPVKVQSTATVTPAQVKVQSTAKAPVTAQATAAAKAPAPTPEPSKEPAPKKTVMSITTTSKKK